jgi:spoIIIJ-associated protein
MNTITKSKLDNQDLALVEEHVRQLIQLMGFSQVLVACRASDKEGATETESYIELNVKIDAGEEGRLLIGTQGAHLFALQHLIRSLLRRQFSAGVCVVVDVNGYRARRERNLASLADSAARQAKSQGKTIVLRPMDASDRRIIHSHLSSWQEVRTESLGEEPNRRVVIKPVFL